MKEKNKPEKTGKKLTKKQTTLVVLCSVLALILILLILGTAYLESLMSLINKDMDNSTMSAEEYEQFLKDQADETVDPNAVVINPDDVLWGDETDLLEKSEDVINVLLIGQDRRPGEGRQRSDAMILCTINKKTKTLTMTSFMRDMYVQIPGYSDNRINACYQIGGMELLNSCLEKNFGVHVDGNVEVDFNGFIGVIDLMGGVSINLTAAEANHLNGNHGYSLHEGTNKLNGEQALNYSRIRYIGNGDFGRTNRQRAVLSALVESSRSLSLSQINELVKDVLPLVTTDMSNSEIVNYTLALFPMLTDLTINNQRIPADNTYQNASIRDMSVLVPDLDANRQILASAMGE